MYKLKQVLEHIQENLDENITLTALADVAGISVFHFSRQFKQSMQMPPHQYVLRQRVERAKQLLKLKGRTIANVAAECGFAHTSHLNQHFKRIVGMSPKQFRQL